MININKCKDTAKALSARSKGEIDAEKLKQFFDNFSKISEEYRNEYILSSKAIQLEQLESFNDWFLGVLEDKELLTPVIVDKMVNEKDLYSLSLYRNLYADTDLVLDRSDCYSKYQEKCLGENDLALMTGCHWIEQINAIE